MLFNRQVDYLTLTRPKLTYVVHTLAQFMQSPCTDHRDVVLHVIRYLKGSPGQGILLSADFPLILTIYCDLD